MINNQFMYTLSDNYILGIVILCSIVVACYLIFSIRLIQTSRREGLDVCISAMIPIYNVVLWVRKCIKKHQNSKVLDLDEEIQL